MADFFSQPAAALAHRAVPVPARTTPRRSPSTRSPTASSGSQFLEDIAEFFILFQTMYDGFVERAEAVTRTLQDRRTTFVVVSTLEAAPAREAEFFIDALDEPGLPPRRAGAQQGAARVPRRPGRDRRRPGAWPRIPTPIAEQLIEPSPTRRWPAPADAAMVARVLREVGESFLNYRVVATREAEQRAELARKPEIVASVPYFDADICDLAGLLRLGEQIWR